MMKQLVILTTLNVIIAFILFLILQGVGTDMIDDIVTQDLDAGASGISLVNYILAFYTLGLIGACAISTIALVKTRRARANLAFLLSVALCYCIMFVIASLSLYAVPGYVLSVETFGITLALYATFVLRNPALYLIIFATVLVASQFSINIIAGVHHAIKE